MTAHATVRDWLFARIGWPRADALVYSKPEKATLLTAVPRVPVAAFRTIHGEGGMDEAYK